MSSTDSGTSSTSAVEDNMTETIEVTIPEQKSAPIPLFLKKLWKMVNDPSAEEIIGWNATGDGFIIYDQVKFVTELLPQYFKHNNLSSFIRQLNFYDFHKVANVDKQEMEFAHSCFLRDLPETLAFITRKVPNVKARTMHDNKNENINEVLTGVKELKSKHNLIDNELKMLKQENAALWNEINSLRIKYSKQTKVINKLIHFLISYMHSHQNSFGKTNMTVSRKIDHKHLKNTAPLFQIDYHTSPKIKNEVKANLKLPGSSKTITLPTNVKNYSHKYYIQPKLQDNSANSVKQDTPISSKKCPLNTINSYPVERIVSEVNPDMYNVTSPDHSEVVLASSLESPYPIEEIVTDVDPNLEETSVYTVKFPKNDVNPNHHLKTSSIPVIDTDIALNQQNVKPSLPSSEVVLKSEGKLIHGKRKLNYNNLSHPSIQKSKILEATHKKGNTLKLMIPKSSQMIKSNKRKGFKQLMAKQPLLKGKRKGQNDSTKKCEKDIPIPQPSPVKPEVVLENLFSEIENPHTISEILSEMPSNSDDLGLQLAADSTETLLDQQSEVIYPVQDNLQSVMNSPSEILSTLSGNTVDSGGTKTTSSSQEEILTSLSNNQGKVESDMQPILKPQTENDLENNLESQLEIYPEEMLSSLSNSVPDVHSPSREILTYNIIENPKENLGLYLDNTQIQLNNIQDLLNDLNSEELFDLLSCFNVDDEDQNSEQRGKS